MIINWRMLMWRHLNAQRMLTWRQMKDKRMLMWRHLDAKRMLTWRLLDAQNYEDLNYFCIYRWEGLKNGIFYLYRGCQGAKTFDISKVFIKWQDPFNLGTQQLSENTSPPQLIRWHRKILHTRLNSGRPQLTNTATTLSTDPWKGATYDCPVITNT